MGDQERQFLSLAIRLGFLSQQEAKQCLYQFEVERRQGGSTPVWKIAIQKGFLTPHQVEHIRSQLHRMSATSGFFPGYRIVRKIGKGGMGTVYEAIQMSLDRRVAIKVLSPEHLRDASYLQRIAREAKVLAKLNHPNIVSAIDFQCQGGVYFLVMEYVEGVSLDEELKKGRIFSEKEVLSIGLQVAHALHHAHQQGLVHRDIKPANIMIDRSGKVKLCDLGLAKETGREKDITQTSKAVGTPIYMSPEQVRGEEIDIRSDIYSLGATLYHLATGKRPYKSQGIGGIFSEILSDYVPNPRKDNPHLSPGFARLIRRMMAKDKKKRPQTPKELIDEIKQVQKQGNISTATHISIAPQRAQTSSERLYLYLALGISLSSLVLISLVTLWLFSEKEKKKKETKIASAALSPPRRQRVSSFEELAQDVFGHTLQKVHPPWLHLSFTPDDIDKLSLFWCRSQGSFGEGKNFFLQETVDFLFPFQKIRLLSIKGNSYSDFLFVLRGKNRQVLLRWYPLLQGLSLSEKGKILFWESVPGRDPTQSPLRIFQKQNRLHIQWGNFTASLPKTFQWEDFTIISKATYSQWENIQLEVLVSRRDLEEALQKMEKKKNLLREAYLTTLEYYPLFSKGSPWTVPKSSSSFYSLFLTLSQPVRKLQIEFPSHKRKLTLVLRKSPTTGYFPTFSLFPFTSYFRVAKATPSKEHKIKILVLPWSVQIYINEELSELIKLRQLQKLPQVSFFSPTFYVSSSTSAKITYSFPEGGS